MNKKHSIIYLLFAFAGVAILMGGCKRGEDDPFLSFKSRDARLSQTWRLVDFSGTRISTEMGETETTTYSFKNETINIVHSPGISENFGYSYIMDISKDGMMNCTQTLSDTTETVQSISDGYWSWNDAGKNKSSVNLAMAGLMFNVETYSIMRLASDELRLVADETIILEDPDLGNSRESVNFELLFEPAP